MAAPDAALPAGSSAQTPAIADAGVTGLLQFVLVHRQGAVWIKFSCPCGQRLLFPTHRPTQVGRCGRCGREHRMIGMEKRIATFEKHLHAAEAAHAAQAKTSEEGLVTRLLRPSEYADAAGPNLQPPPDDFRAFYESLVNDPAADHSAAARAPVAPTTSIPPQRSGAKRAAEPDDLHLAAGETVELPPLPARAQPPGDAKSAADSADNTTAQPGETASLTDFDLARFEPLNSARVRETADLAADRLRPRASQPAPAQAGGLVWAWPPATHFARLLAGGVDLILPALGAAAGAFVARWAGASIGARLTWAWLLLLGLGLLLDLGGRLIWRRVSPGKQLAGIHVRHENGGLPSWPRSLARAVIKWSLTPIWWPLAFGDPLGRTLHDRICATRVMFGRPRA